jgi:uncharacterized OB-fold protein
MSTAPFLAPRTTGIPVPEPTALSEPYWEGCRAGELRFQRCQHCGAIPPLPTPRCRRCLRPELTWEASGGRGRLYSWTIVWRPQHPAFEVPYAPAVVAMDEGFFVMSAMVSCRADALTVDLPVEVTFARVSEAITLPFYAPAGRHSGC